MRATIAQPIPLLTISILFLTASGCGQFPDLFAVRATIPDDPAVAALFAPAPRLPVGFYDYFGSLKSPTEARQMVP